MDRNLPPPVCTVFLICRQIVENPSLNETVLHGLPLGFNSRHFPAAGPLGFFARCTSAHGRYLMEVSLRTAGGEVVWRDGPPDSWALEDPMRQYDLKLTLCPVYPAPGIYDFVLTANGEEIARQKFVVQPLPQTGNI